MRWLQSSWHGLHNLYQAALLLWRLFADHYQIIYPELRQCRLGRWSSQPGSIAPPKPGKCRGIAAAPGTQVRPGDKLFEPEIDLGTRFR